MKEFYISYDNRVFEDKNDCIEYEKTLNKNDLNSKIDYLMFKFDGSLTSDLNDCETIYIACYGEDTLDDINKRINLLKSTYNNDETLKNIEGIGWYSYDDDCYIHVPYGSFTSMYNIFNTHGLDPENLNCMEDYNWKHEI